MSLQRLGEHFYATLFRMDPSLPETLFRGVNQRVQSLKLMEMIDQAVQLADKPVLGPLLTDLGRRHYARYGVKPEHFGVVGSALISTLETVLAPTPLDADVRLSWIKVYGVVSDGMIAGMKVAELEKIAAEEEKQARRRAEEEALRRALEDEKRRALEEQQAEQQRERERNLSSSQYGSPLTPKTQAPTRSESELRAIARMGDPSCLQEFLDLDQGDSDDEEEADDPDAMITRFGLRVAFRDAAIVSLSWNQLDEATKRIAVTTSISKMSTSSFWPKGATLKESDAFVRSFHSLLDRVAGLILKQREFLKPEEADFTLTTRSIFPSTDFQFTPLDEGFCELLKHMLPELQSKHALGNHPGFKLAWLTFFGGWIKVLANNA